MYDPQGSGKKDYEDLVDRAFDGDPTSKWTTWVYFDQFAPPAQGGLKEGVGLLLELEKPVTVNTVQVSTTSPGITVQIRSIPDGNVNTPLEQTQVIGSATIGTTDPVTIPTSGAKPRSTWWSSSPSWCRWTATSRAICPTSRSPRRPDLPERNITARRLGR